MKIIVFLASGTIRLEKVLQVFRSGLFIPSLVQKISRGIQIPAIQPPLVFVIKLCSSSLFWYDWISVLPKREIIFVCAVWFPLNQFRFWLSEIPRSLVWFLPRICCHRCAIDAIESGRGHKSREPHHLALTHHYNHNLLAFLCPPADSLAAAADSQAAGGACPGPGRLWQRQLRGPKETNQETENATDVSWEEGLAEWCSVRLEPGEAKPLKHIFVEFADLTFSGFATWAPFVTLAPFWL